MRVNFFAYSLILLFLLLSKISPSFSKEFSSLKKVTTKANLRAGPGDWYPIKWVLTNPNLPVRIIDNSGNYSKVQLHDGTIGWLSKNLISKKNNLIVIKNTNLTSKSGSIRAIVLKDIIIKEHDCNEKVSSKKKCQVKIMGHKGYIPKEDLWGISKY